MTRALMNRRIAVLAADGFEKVELTIPVALDAVLWAAPYAAIGCGLYLAAKQFSSRNY